MPSRGRRAAHASNLLSGFRLCMIPTVVTSSASRVQSCDSLSLGKAAQDIFRVAKNVNEMHDVSGRCGILRTKLATEQR